MQKRIIKVDNKVVVLFEDGTYLERSGVTSEEFDKIKEADTDEDLAVLVCPAMGKARKEYNDTKELIKNVENSRLLKFTRDSIYWEEVSSLSVPPELAEAVITAELEDNQVKIETYKNFWTLMCLNPDERCRKNLFWFLNKNGLVISRCGFFVAYRNVDFKGTDPDGTQVFTDHHSHSFSIRIGKVVTMPREKCDPVQEHTCSRGLHLGSRHWLTRNYYGSQGLVCLCNPADVVAVPPLDDYGKLRTCAYLPIEKAEFDSEGKVIPFKANDGFDCGYVTQVIYEGLMGTDEDSPYKIHIPNVPGINKESVANTLLDIAKKCITDRQL